LNRLKIADGPVVSPGLTFQAPGRIDHYRTPGRGFFVRAFYVMVNQAVTGPAIFQRQGGIHMTFQGSEQSSRVVGQRYKILRQLREEPWGEVWLAHDLWVAAEVGLKALTREDEAWGRGQQILEQEAALGLRLRHPQILGVFHLERTEAAVYLVEEPFPGESLLGYLTRPQRFSLPQSVQLLTQISEALAFAHQRGVVHQSLNPLQILISGTEVRLANFACPRPEPVQAMHLELRAYDPPEVVHGDPQTAAGNVFSLGVLGFRLLAGSLPYPLTFDEPFPYRLEIPRADLEEIPEALQNLLLRALAEDPEARFPHAGAFLEQLRQVPDIKAGPTSINPVSWNPEPAGTARQGLTQAGAFLADLWPKIKPQALKLREKAEELGGALKAAPRRVWWGLGAAGLVVVVLTVAVKMASRAAPVPKPPVTVVAPVTLPPTGGVPPLLESPEPAPETAQPSPGPATAPAARPESTKAPKDERYMLVLATFKDQKQAQALQKKLKARGLKARTVSSKSGKKLLYQVQVGPVLGAQAAEQAAASIKAQEKITPKVMKLSNHTGKNTATAKNTATTKKTTSRRQAR
jgi:eukaryotic-like serine/threonine-protein kinase